MTFLVMVILWFTKDISAGGILRELSNVDFERTGRAGGIAVSDLDNDGSLEVIIAVLDGGNKILKYDSETQLYYDVAATDPKYAGVRDPQGKAVSVCSCDMNGDGIQELYIHNNNDVFQTGSDVAVNTDRLFKIKDGEYVDMLSLDKGGRTIAPRYGGHSVACIDRTGDGHYDVIVTTFTKEGKGAYRVISLRDSAGNTTSVSDISEEIGLAAERDGFGVLVGPFVQKDYHSDIFITNDHTNHVGSSTTRHDGNNMFFRNRGNGKFAESVELKDENENGRGAALGDFNNDGLMDVLVTNWLRPSRIYMQKSGTETDFQNYITNSSFLFPSATSVLIIGDFNNDGHTDVIKSGGDDNLPDPAYNEVFTILNQRNSTDFELVPSNLGIQNRFKRIKMQGIAAADINGDGLLELIISHEPFNDKTISIFQENWNTFNWIRLQPLTKQGAPAIGSIVTLTYGYNDKRRIVIGGVCSYMCQSEGLAHFGLGSDIAKDVSVTWPDGHNIQRFLNKQDNKKTLKVTYYGNVVYTDAQPALDQVTSAYACLFGNLGLFITYNVLALLLRTLSSTL